MALNYLPEAVPTAIGWAHPLTGEQLTAGALTVGQLNGDVAVAYYKPNAEGKSFIDPEGSTENLIFSMMRGSRVDFAVHSKHKIASVAWTFGDTSTAVAGPVTKHNYAAGAYAVAADVTFDGQNVASATVGAGGAGYTTATVAFSAPANGSAATGTATITTGAITAITITNGGSGYTEAPTVTITGDGTGATATAAVATVPNSTLNIASIVVA